MEIRNVLKTWIEKGAVNSVHQLKLLDAEYYAFHKKDEKARIRFEEACTMAIEEGFIHNAALANERYAEYLARSDVGADDRESEIRIQMAMKYYREWGAMTKVGMLTKRYPYLVSGSKREMTVTSRVFDC